MLDQIETWMAPDSWPKTGWISVHGDAHGGNLLWLDGKRPVFLDFDDAWTALAAQDLWLCEPSAADFPREKEAFQDAYDEIRPYPFEELGWIPRLRAMRMIHYAAWIANRWSDPAFPKAFAHFGTNEYWMREIEALSILMDPPAETYSHDSD
jgi:Ser/Thr protein kinase RdoA (MazF antagonist)